jgi:hypothetical protein
MAHRRYVIVSSDDKAGHRKRFRKEGLPRVPGCEASPERFRVSGAESLSITECVFLIIGYRGRAVEEIGFEKPDLIISGLPAVDFFGDGSFYLLDTPGVSSRLENGCNLTISLKVYGILLFLALSRAYHCSGSGQGRLFCTSRRRLLPSSWPA